MIVEILKASISIKKKISVFLLIQSIITFILIITVLSSINQTTASVKHLESITGSIYKIDDNFIGDTEKQFFTQPDNVDILKRLYTWESTNKRFTYIVAGHQNVETVDKNFPDIFEYGYDSGHAVQNIYNSLQINDNFTSKYSLTVSAGRLFTRTDYSIDNQVIPILLGSDYKRYANLHDRFKMSFLSKPFTCEVVGFLSNNCFYNNGYNIQTLDRYIILPSMEVNSASTNTEEKTFELKLYLDKCSGYVYSNLPATSMQNMFTEKCYALDITPYQLEGVNNFYPTMWGLEGKQLQSFLLMFVTIITIVSIVCMSINMAVKIIDLKKNYAIYIANGMNKIGLYFSIFLEIAIMNCISLIISTILGFLLGKQIPTFQMISIFLIMCLFSCIYPFIVFKKINLSKVLRGDE